MSEPISAAILAGGQSSRMGANKALMQVGGRPIVERVIDQVRPLADDLVLIANTATDYAHLGLPIFPDLLPGRGPLGGLYTAITQAQHAHTLVTSCDLPFLSPSLLRFLIDLREGWDVVVPLDREGYPQGLHAVYGKGCLEPIRRRLDANLLKVSGLFDDVRVRYVTGEEIDRFDPERLSFFNANTPRDALQAERLAAASNRPVSLKSSDEANQPEKAPQEKSHQNSGEDHHAD
jgi:molybdenum cofactor guanylyltransferase